MAKPPVKRTIKDLFAPRDATETSRQGQGIGDIEAMRQTVPEAIKAAWQATQDAGTQQREGLGRLLTGRATQDDMINMASDFALPVMGSVRKIGSNAVAKEAAKEAARVANRDMYFPEKVFHSTTSPTGIKAFKAELGSGTAWHDLPGAHVGTLDAATQRAEAYAGPKFEATPYTSNKTGAEDPTRMKAVTSILPLRMRAEKPFVSAEGKPFSEAELGNIVNQWAVDRGYFSTTLPKEDPLYRASHIVRRDAARKDFAQQLLKQGYDVVPYINAVEDQGKLSYLVLNPSRLRSEFAKFDPKKLNSANLSAGLGSLFVGGAMAKAATRDKKNDQ